MHSQREPQIKPSPEHYTVAIICSLACQLNAIKCMFDITFETPLIDQEKDSNTYTCGSINGHNVVVASKGLFETGVVNASVQTGFLKHSFVSLNSIIVFGTAGGIPPKSPESDSTKDIRLGDVVVGWAGPGKDSIVQWDSGVYKSREIESISAFDLPSQRFRNALGKLQAKRDHLDNTEFKKNLDRCIHNKDFSFSQPEPESDVLFISTYIHPQGKPNCKECDLSMKINRRKREDPAKVEIHYGTIASGSSIVKSAERRDRVRDATGALCIEMSAAGVAACDGTNPLVVKGISDYADSHKTDDMEQWRSYAAATAAAFVRELLYTMDPGLLPRTNYNQLNKSNSETQDCLRDLRSTDPSVDKTRIEYTKGGLLPGLHEWIFEDNDFETWRDNKESRLLWIRGDPGKGKTMLLCGIIDELKKSPTNTVSFFFCEAADSRINNATTVLRGLIYLLVKEHDSLVSHVRDHAGEKPLEGENAWWVLLKMFESIIQDPNLQNTYLIVDALDECVTDLPLLLKIIAQNLSASSGVKWIVSSRNLSTITEDLDAATQKVPLCLESKHKSIAAVSTYIEYKVKQLTRRKKYDDGIRNAVKKHLSSNAENTFLWVDMVCRELEKVDQWEYPVDVLSMYPLGLDPLYQRMMECVCNSKKADLCKRILAVISTVYRPITLQDLTSFIDMPHTSDNQNFLVNIIGHCGSFLTLRDHTVYFTHQSAKDFLLEKAMDKIFPSGIKTVHYSIFSRSLRVMSDKLHRPDIYGLKHPGFSIDQVEQPEPDPLAAVRYSCAYWVDHLCECNQSSSSSWHALSRTREYKVRSITPPDPDDHMSSSLRKWYHLSSSRFWIYLWFSINLIYVLLCDLKTVIKTNSDLQDRGSVDKFLHQSYLPWLEALSLLRSLSSGVLMIRKLENRLQAGRSPDLHAFVHDAKMFALYNRSVIEQTPLQLYCSALIFAPEQSIIRKTFENYIPNWIERKPRVQTYWNTALQTLEGHSDWVESVAFSPNNTLLASCSFDKTIKLWDGGSGMTVATIFCHSKVYDIAFSPDSKRLASCSEDRTVKLWDPNKIGDQDEAIATFHGHRNLITTIAFSPDGTKLASCSNDRTVRLWDPNKIGKQETAIATFGGYTAPITAFAFSPTGRQLASHSTIDKNIKLWDLTELVDQDKAIATFGGRKGWFKAIAFSPNGNRLASFSSDKTIEIWDLTKLGDQTKTTARFYGHGNLVTAIAFSPDGAKLASCSEDGTVRLWDPNQTGNQDEAIATFDGRSGSIRTIAFSPDGRQLASCSGDGTIKLWDPTKTGDQHKALAKFDGHSSRSIRTIAFSPDGRQLAWCPNDKTINLWTPIKTVDQNEAATTMFHGDSTEVSVIAFSPVDTRLASCSDDNTIKLWDPETGDQDKAIATFYCSSNVRDIAFSPNGKHLVSRLDSNTVELWDPNEIGDQHNALKTFVCHKRKIKAVTFSSDSKHLASFSKDGVVKLWDPNKTGDQDEAIATFDCSNKIKNIALSPNGTQLASCFHTDDTIQLWDSTKLGDQDTAIATFHNDKEHVNGIAFSFNGKRLASYSNKFIKVWNTDKTIERNKAIAETYCYDIRDIAFSPDGKMLASCLNEGIVKFWDLNETDNQLMERPQLQLEAAVEQLSFSGDGSYLTTDKGVIKNPFSKQTKHEEPQFFVSDEWIMLDLRKLLWLSTEHRATCVAVKGQRIALGHASGGISYFCFDVSKIES